MWCTFAPVAVVAALILALLLTGCASRRSATASGVGWAERGLASWYGPGFHGKPTASGEIYDMNALTAAHRTLPFETVVEVRNRDNGRRVQVRITDRGPFIRGRIIDLSYEAAQRLAIVGPGVAPVEIRIVRSPVGERNAGSFWVQVGAFRDQNEAQRFQRRIRRQFEDAQLFADGDWFRVRIGPFRKRKQADATLDELRRLGIDAFLLRL